MPHPCPESTRRLLHHSSNSRLLTPPLGGQVLAALCVVYAVYASGGFGTMSTEEVGMSDGSRLGRAQTMVNQNVNAWTAKNL